VEAAKLALEDPEICYRAVELVARGRDRALAMDFLIEALARVASRQAALRAFGSRMPMMTRNEAQPALRRAVAERTGEALAGAALGLATTGEIHVEGLRAAVRSEDEKTRSEACLFLATVGPEAAPAAADLVAALDRYDRGPHHVAGMELTLSRRYAAAALGAIGPAARAHLPALREAAGSAGLLEPYYAVAIARIEGGLLAVLETGDTNRSVAWQALGFCGLAGVRELGQVIVLAEWNLREEAAHQLTQKGENAVLVATELLRHERKDVRVKAAWVLGTMGASDGVPALIQALKDRDTEVRMQAAWALGMIRSESALPALEELRKDEEMRQVAEEAIRRIRPAK
jgi:HEAT repeat protein